MLACPVVAQGISAIYARPGATGKGIGLAFSALASGLRWPPKLKFPTTLLCVRIPFLKNGMTRQEVLDLYFMEARAKLLDIAAFMDRVDRAVGDDDFRMTAFRKTLAALNAKQNRAEEVLLSLSDPTTEPIAAATTKAASGAYVASKKG